MHGQESRANGTIEPFWTMLDLSPSGRPDFREQQEYNCCTNETAKALGGV